MKDNTKAEFVRNPLAELPPRMKCPCKSGKAFGKCCASVTPTMIPKERYWAWVKTKDLALRGKKAW